MYTKRHYEFSKTLNWSKKPLILGTLYATAVCGIAYFVQFELRLPWQPISVMGITVAFYLGFKNNASYDRTWEARKIWGGIVNDSRSFAGSVLAFVQGEDKAALTRELIYRHIAWLTALRYQLRLSRTWEHQDDRIKSLYLPTACENYNQKLDNELLQYITQEELNQYKGKANTATQLLATQMKRLHDLAEAGHYNNFQHIEMHELVTRFYDGQGKAERIKNFPFPRQYASTALWLTMLFCGLLPWAMLDIFKEHNNWYFILCPVISGLLIWTFFLMEKIGDYSENPFEGSYNDVPITSIARGIEIDLRQMFNDTDIPAKVEVQNGFLL